MTDKYRDDIIEGEDQDQDEDRRGPEKFCSLCRRPESQAGKMIDLPNNIHSLPEDMEKAAQEAQDTLLHTGDGQLCDIILDRASLEAVYRAGMDSSEEVLKRYAQLTVDAADIRIAVRCGKVGKSLDFIERALAPCPGIDMEALAHGALGGTESVAACLEGTEYAQAAEALRKSPAAFEKWCDDLIIEEIRPQKYNPFTLGPLAAYILARRNEIKCVRMILTGRQNELPDNVIRERLREMYV